MSEEKTTISCAVCRDLMPLVADGVASEDSEALVRAHIETCAECKRQWETGSPPPVPPAPPGPDDEKVLNQLKSRVNGLLTLFVVLGLAVGLAVGNMSFAGGLLIMIVFPLVCGVAYWFDRKAWRLVPPLAAGLEAINILFITRGGWVSWGIRLRNAGSRAVFIFILCLVGALAAALFRYAFGGKEK